MHLRLGLVRLPQFFLDGLELLAEEVLALRLVHLRLHLGLNLGTQLQHFQLSIHNLREVAQSSRHINLFQELLLLFRPYAHRGGDEEAERTRVLNVQRRHLQLFRKVRDELHYAAVDGGQIALECLQFFSFFREVIQITDLSAQERLFFQVVIYSNPADTLDQDAKCAVRRLHHLLHQRESTDIVGIIWAGSSTCGSFTATRPTSLSPDKTWSISLTERDCPTARGTMSSGKTTVSLRGSMGMLLGVMGESSSPFSGAITVVNSVASWGRSSTPSCLNLGEFILSMRYGTPIRLQVQVIPPGLVSRILWGSAAAPNSPEEGESVSYTH